MGGGESSVFVYVSVHKNCPIALTYFAPTAVRSIPRSFCPVATLVLTSELFSNNFHCRGNGFNKTIEYHNIATVLD